MQRAIETRYKQRLFRSRLEARYAVLFDALAINWDYEPEAFDLGFGQWYLPDFFLHWAGDGQPPGSGYWVEVKGRTPTQDETRKLNLLCTQTGHSGYLFTGSPGEGRVFQHDGVPVNNPLACTAALMCCTHLPGARYRQTFDVAVERALSARFDPKGQTTA